MDLHFWTLYFVDVVDFDTVI